MSEVSLINTLKAIEGDCESWLDNKEKDPLLQLASAYRLIVAIRDAAVAATRKVATTKTKEKKKP